MLPSLPLLRLLQLTSPALPVGAYSYSEGLEWLVESAIVTNAATLDHWLRQELQYGSIRLEGAVVWRCLDALATGDGAAVAGWNRWLSAVRETEELRLQSWQMGRSLLKLLRDLHPDWAPDPMLQLGQREECNFAVAFAIAAHYWQLDASTALLGYLYSWAANLVNAGIRLIPLGQTVGQRLLSSLHPELLVAVDAIAACPDAEMGSCGWGLAIASMNHEVQYSRLFRS